MSQPQFSSMPPDDGSVYRTLWQEVQGVHLAWMVYRQLYGTSSDRIALLNRFGGVAFGLYQHLLNHHIVLAISRLLDPGAQRGGKHQNLCLQTHVPHPRAQVCDVDFIKIRDTGEQEGIARNPRQEELPWQWPHRIPSPCKPRSSVPCLSSRPTSTSWISPTPSTALFPGKARSPWALSVKSSSPTASPPPSRCIASGNGPSLPA